MEKEEFNSTLRIINNQFFTRIDPIALEKYKILKNKGLIDIIDYDTYSIANIRSEGREYLKNLVNNPPNS